MFKLGDKKTRPRFTPSLISYVVLALATIILLYWRLASLTAGLSKPEVISRHESANIDGLLTNPVDAPYHLLQKLLISLHSSIFNLRLTSALIAAIIIFGFFQYAKGLFGRIIGLLGSLILVSLPYFSISGRQAAPQVMLFLPLLIMYVFHIFTKSESRSMAWLVLALLAGIAVYTPGLVWWLAAAVMLSYKKLSDALSELQSAITGIGIGIFGLCITPLIVISAIHPSALRQLFIIPGSWPKPLHFGTEIIQMTSAIIFKSQGNSFLLLNNLAILNVTLIALAAFGGYALFIAARGKAASLGLSLILAVLLSSLAGNVAYLALAVPALILLITAGLRYLYVEWRSVFPRNPVPKTFALILITAVTLSQLFYGINYCLHAWPHSRAISQAFVLK